MTRFSASRRNFLVRTAQASAALGLAGTGVARATGPIERKGDPHFKLSLAGYSFRDHFVHFKGNSRDKGRNAMTMTKFIDYCAEHGFAGAELTSYFFEPGASDEYLLGLKRHAYLKGVTINGTAVGNNFALPEGDARERQIADLKMWIDKAAVLGAPHIRVFAGAPRGIGKEEAKKLCVAALQECCDYAGTKGVFLGLENHGGIVAEVDDLIDIVEGVDSPWFGVNLDTGNFHTEDPYADLAKAAAYAINVQLKVEIRPAGKPHEPADFERLAKILRDANYQGFVVLEYEAGKPYEEIPGYLEKMRKAFA